jgi:hypothetical protein
MIKETGRRGAVVRGKSRPDFCVELRSAAKPFFRPRVLEPEADEIMRRAAGSSDAFDVDRALLAGCFAPIMAPPSALGKSGWRAARPGEAF